MNALAGILLLVAALAAWAGPTWRPRSLPGVDRGRPWTIGHRGARGPRRENTLSAFELAFARTDGIETDVQRTRDGALVLWHDFDCHGREVRDATLAELRELEPELPTLDELLDLARTYPGTVLNLELKSRPEPARAWHLERATIRTVRRAGASDRTLISSFDPFALARVRLSAPRLRTALLIAPELPSWVRSGVLARWLHVDALHPRHDQIDGKMLRWAAAHALPLHAWTVNEPEEMERLVAAGVAGLIIDDPEALARLGKGRTG